MAESRFTRRTPTGETIQFILDGAPAMARAGDTLAAAILALDGSPLRTTGVSGAPRTPFCMMGVCFDCLVEVDSRPNVQSCLVEVTEGMVVRRQDGFRKLGGAHD